MESSSKAKKVIARQTKEEGKFKLNAKSIAQIAMLSAIALILMLFEFPLWFAPPFYQIDLSEVPVLIGGFALGPVAGVLIELVKNLLKVVINTSTGGVGEVANFVIGSAFVLPSALYYRRNKSKKGAAISMILGTISMTILGSLINAYILLPFYSKALGLPIDALVEMGTAVNPNITSLPTFIMLAVAPFNLFKGAIVYNYLHNIQKNQRDFTLTNRRVLHELDMIIDSFKAEDTFEIGRKLGKKAKPGEIICLFGDLGVGKTVLAKGIAEGLGINEPINSPTFTILQVYDEGRIPLYHFDVYRIEEVEEMYEIGFEDYFYGEGLCIVEWANIIEEILPSKRTIINIEKDLDKGFDYRKITIDELGGKNESTGI